MSSEFNEVTDYEEHLDPSNRRSRDRTNNPFEGRSRIIQPIPNPTVPRRTSKGIIQKTVTFEATTDDSVVPVVDGKPVKGIELEGVEPTFLYKHPQDTLDQADKQRRAIRHNTKKHGRR